MNDWLEKASPSDFSLFMDGFLYISSSQAKITPDRRGRDGESPSNRSERLRVVLSVRPSKVRSSYAPVDQSLSACQLSKRRSFNPRAKAINGSGVQRGVCTIPAPPGTLVRQKYVLV